MTTPPAHKESAATATDPGPPDISVLGAGSWGTALAISLANRGHGGQVTLWSHSQRVLDQIRATGQNTSYLPGIAIPPTVHTTGSLEQAAASSILLCVTPSQHLRATIQALAPFLRPGHILVSATKGLEGGLESTASPHSEGNATYLRMSQVIADVIASHPAQHGVPAPRIAVLSGPSFAQEVAIGMPTAVAIASSDAEVAHLLQREFSSPTFRLYTNSDITGVELGGALKNVIAISAGIVSGLGLGHNSSAGLITRGIAEITRLAVACGGHAETLAGLSGLGDLVLTCTGSLSRNRSVGIELGRGRKLPEILASLNGKVAEGVRTTTAALGLARRHGVEMPITEQMEAILHHGKAPKDAIRDLMSRPGREE